jgi:hypothetical protein
VTLPGNSAHLKPPVIGTPANDVAFDAVELAANSTSDRIADMATAIHDHQTVMIAGTVP